MSTAPPTETPAPARRSLWLLPWDVLTWPARRALRLLLSGRGVALTLLALIAALVAATALTNRHTPYTGDAYVQAYVVQVAPRVEGQVERVYVTENQRVKRGDPLFDLDPRPFDHKIALLRARLGAAESHVAQLRAELDAFKADETRVGAEEDFAQAVFRQEAEIFKAESTTERRYLDAVQKQKAAAAARVRSRAARRKAEEAVNARVGDEHVLVAEVRAQLAEAELNREWARVVAPADGYVTNVQLRVGSYAQAGKPVLSFVDTGQWWVVANYRENCLEGLREGQPVELSFNAYPGRVVSGRVHSVGWGVSEGQGVPSGELPPVKNPAAWVRPAQRFQVRVEADTPDDLPLRVGTGVAVTVYTDDHWIAPLARARQQVVSWWDYLY